MNNTPQTEKIEGTDQILNDASGYNYQVTPWEQFERFLILGSEGGTYYVGEKKFTADNSKNVLECIKKNGKKAVKVIHTISKEGRAPKNAPAIFALALCAKFGNLETKKAAFKLLPEIARTATDFFSFVQQYKDLGGGMGSVAKKGLQNWYQSKDVSRLGEQLIKYRQRDGWTHHDVLHLAHVKATTPEENNLYSFAKYLADNKAKYDQELLPNIALGYLIAKSAKTDSEIVRAINEFKLPREAIPTEFLNSPKVWEALLPHMGATALIRNLGKMTSVGLISATNDAEKLVCDKLANDEWLHKSLIHPMNVFAAFKVYEQGHGVKGSLVWTPTNKVKNALDSAFYKAFKNVEPTGKKIHLSLDISGSMFGATVNGMDFVDAATASAVMAMVLIATESNIYTTAYTTSLREIDLHAKMRLDKVVRKMHELSRYMGGTDCAQPFIWSAKKNQEFDAFITFTDNASWAGDMHSCQALEQYRKKMKIPAKFVVAATTATNNSIGDIKDKNSLNVVGMDAAVPKIIGDFLRN